MRSNGVLLYQTARILNFRSAGILVYHKHSIGVKTLRDKGFTATTIAKILDNPAYKGIIEWTTNKGKKNEETIRAEGKHEAIISKEVWDKTRELRKNEKRIERIYDGDFFLTGLLKCPECGASMIGDTRDGGKYRYYRCLNNFTKGSAICSSNLVNAKKIEDEVMKNISKIIKNKKILKQVVEELNKENENIEKKKEAVKNFKNELKKIDTSREVFYNKIIACEIEAESLTKFEEYANLKEKEIKELINKLNIEIEEQSKLVDFNKVRQIMQDKLINLIDKDNKRKKELLGTIIEEITVHKGNTAKERTLKDIKLFLSSEEVSEDFNYNNVCVNDDTAMSPF